MDVGTLGILDHEDAQHEIKNAARFLKAGIRTALPIAEIELKQIVDEHGKRISIEEARRRGMIHGAERRPVLLLRAFGTKLRVVDISRAHEPRRMIKEAKAVLNRELGRTLTDREYVEWFAKNLGEQVARMHLKGWTHSYLGPHNITLDGRIVDLDSVKKSRYYNEDLDSIGHTLRSFCSACDLAGVNRSAGIRPVEVIDLFKRTYEQKMKQH